MTRPADVLALSLDDYHGLDVEMEKCLDQARLAARTDLPILILGESGTGKTLLARAIHNSSSRAHGPFVSFNAAALSDTLMDSQLFGHERGAFTGAQNRLKGKFELAHRGTLFIDEIADMSPAGQAKILRAVEYGEFERLGSETIQEADVRLISATHFPVHTFMEADRFRQDLFFRISGLVVTVPPLRERRKDLPLLLAAEIGRASRKQGKSIQGLERGAAERLFSYSWPGNLRETLAGDRRGGRDRERRRHHRGCAALSGLSRFSRDGTERTGGCTDDPIGGGKRGLDPGGGRTPARSQRPRANGRQQAPRRQSARDLPLDARPQALAAIAEFALAPSPAGEGRGDGRTVAPIDCSSPVAASALPSP